MITARVTGVLSAGDFTDRLQRVYLTFYSEGRTMTGGVTMVNRNDWKLDDEFEVTLTEMGNAKSRFAKETK